MNRGVTIDRYAELDLFRDILASRCAERILLIEAPSGYGKTQLLIEYRKIACHFDIPCASVDLRNQCGSVAFVLFKLGADWNVDLATFHRQMADWGQSPTEINIRGVVQIGQPHIQLVLGQQSEGGRRERRHLLTEALMVDIRRWIETRGQALVLVDTYNRAADDVVDPELREWVEGIWLPHVRRTPGLTAVLAGQQVPPRNVEWEECCRRIELTPLDDPDAWLPYIEAIGVKASREVVSAVCHLNRGEPMAIATDLNALHNWGGGK